MAAEPGRVRRLWALYKGRCLSGGLIASLDEYWPDGQAAPAGRVLRQLPRLLSLPPDERPGLDLGLAG